MAILRLLLRVATFVHVLWETSKRAPSLRMERNVLWYRIHPRKPLPTIRISALPIPWTPPLHPFDKPTLPVWLVEWVLARNVPSMAGPKYGLVTQHFEQVLPLPPQLAATTNGDNKYRLYKVTNDQQHATLTRIPCASGQDCTIACDASCSCTLYAADLTTVLGPCPLATRPEPTSAPSSLPTPSPMAAAVLATNTGSGSSESVSAPVLVVAPVVGSGGGHGGGTSDAFSPTTKAVWLQISLLPLLVGAGTTSVLVDIILRTF